MGPALCARCHKNVAVIYVTKIENGKTSSEGLCLKCARELGMKPVDDFMQKMGITDDDIENMAGEMMEALNGAENLPESGDDDDGEDDSGKTATFPFLGKLFGAQDMGPGPGQGGGSADKGNDKRQHKDRERKRKYLDTYCISLTNRAREMQ